MIPHPAPLGCPYRTPRKVLPGVIAVTVTVISPRFGTLNECTGPKFKGWTDPWNISTVFFEGSVGPPHADAIRPRHSAAASRPFIIAPLFHCYFPAG